VHSASSALQTASARSLADLDTRLAVDVLDG
jgi:hypothetical protein